METSKFYLFDTGVIRTLKGLDKVSAKTFEFGNLFETFLVNKMRAYPSYNNRSFKMSYWKTTSNFEVDLIVGNMKVAIEFKSSDRITKDHLKGLKALLEEHSPEQALLVCNEKEPRKLENGIRILPYHNFLNLLWSNELF
jgi:predicted AAA+ superfamily ATPase